MSDRIQIGVLGAANILESSLLKPVRGIGSFQVAALASTRYEMALKLAEKYGIEQVYDNYEDLLKQDRIDMVYIPLINRLHAPWVIEAAKAKKHILVEKPICTSIAEAEAIAKVQKEHGVLIMEDVMTGAHPWQELVKQWVKEEQYGRLLEINTLMSTRIRSDQGNYRTRREAGSGTFFDEGCYWVQMLQKIVGLEEYRIQSVKQENNSAGIDVDFQTVILLGSRIVSRFHCTFEGSDRAEHEFVFEQAVIRLRNIFRCCYGRFRLNLEVYNRQGVLLEKIALEPQNYYINQLRAAAEAISATNRESSCTEALERIKFMCDIYLH